MKMHTRRLLFVSGYYWRTYCTYQAFIRTVTVLPTEALITLATVRTIQIVTLSTLARFTLGTFVDVIFATITTKSRVSAIAAKIIEQIPTLASITRLGCAFVNVILTF